MSKLNAILLLVPGFPADESDSSCLPAIQSYVETLSNRCPATSIDVVAFQYPYERRSYRWRGVRVHALGGRNAHPSKVRTWWRAIQSGRGLMAGRCGTIHSFWLGECAMVGALLARRRGWTHVVSVGGQEVRRQSIYSLLLRHATFTLTAGSDFAAAHALRVLGQAVDAVIPLGIDVGRIRSEPDSSAPIPSVPGQPAKGRPIDVLVVGSLVPVKRTDEVVDVISRIVGERPDLTVEIVGDGPLRPRLEARIGEAHLGENIVLRGRLPREDVLRLMRRSKILLHPSEYESQGYVFLEALSSGMYVVCRNVGFQPASPNVDYARDIDGMAAAVAKRLGRPHEPESVDVPSADWTVDAFSAYYSLSTSEGSNRRTKRLP